MKPSLLLAAIGLTMSSAFKGIRVVSYNVLSSHLSQPTHYTTLNPEHLLAANRLPVVLDKLKAEISKDDDAKDTVFCLQEVSHDWAGHLHTFFANQGYHLVTGLYGRNFNGYMGVAVAWPMSKLSVLDVDISRLSDKREGGWPRPPEDENKPNILYRAVGYVWSTAVSVIKPRMITLGLLDKPPIDPWYMSENRQNILISVKLQDKKSDVSFCIGCYHMPCVFYAPKVMTIHTEMAARHVQTFANGTPYVLAGDWNIKPIDSTYRLLTTGKMDIGDPTYPDPKHGMMWSPTIDGMRSAYAEYDPAGKEPDFTNYARIKEDDPFIDTLDYIFLSDEWKVTGVKDLPHRDEAGGPFPNLEKGEPSDHILVAADLALSK